MKKIICFIRKCKIIKGIILCTSFVFPIICSMYMGGSKIIAFNYIWVAFYSSLLVCVIYETKGIKIFVSCVNAICVVGMTIFFLMGGIELIPGVVWNAIIPFLPNPWY